MKQLQHFLFIDRPRLRCYFDQLTAPNQRLKTTKVPTWQVSLGLTGPSARGGEEVVHQEVTDHDRIETVEEALRNSGQVASDLAGIRAFDETSPQFLLQHHRCRRVLVPPDVADAAAGLSHLAIWISDLQSVRQAGTQGQYVLLVESFPGTDKSSVAPFSGHSAFMCVLNFMREVADRYEKTLSVGDELGLLWPRRTTQEEVFTEFLDDPLGAAEAMKFVVGPSRDIRALSRVRAIFAHYDEETSMFQRGAVGYPIYVADANRVPEIGLRLP